MESERDVSRCAFIQRLGALGVAGLGAGSLLTACDSGGSTGEMNVARVFEVTVREMGSSHPHSGQNNVGVAFAIDGEAGKVITLERGTTYEFALQGSVNQGPNGFPHPFYVGNTAEGTGGDEFNEGVKNAQATPARSSSRPQRALRTLSSPCVTTTSTWADG